MYVVKRIKRVNMDPTETTAFILMILFHLTNVISGASLGNVKQFNESFDAEENHRTVLQNIQNNYADESRNYEMADIENFLSGFMTPVKKEKTPIYTSKTFFGSDQFFGARERSKDNSQHQSWDPFQENRVVGSKPSYFDTPDDLFQQYAYSKNNQEKSHFKTGGDNADFPRGTKDLLENKNKPTFLDETEDKVNDLSLPVADNLENELDELAHPVDGDAENDLDELSHNVDDDAEDELDELSLRIDDDGEDELDEFSHPIDDDGDNELDELLQPVDDDSEDELDELSHPVGEDELYELSHPIDDDGEDELEELSQPIDDDGEDELGELSHPADDDGEDEFSHPIDDDGEDELDELLQPVDDDSEDELDELSHPVGEDELDELSHPIDDDGEDELEELSQPIDDDAEDELDEFLHPVDDDGEDELGELSHPADDDGEDELDELSHPIDDDSENELDEVSHPIGEDQQNELSRSIDDGSKVLEDKLPRPVDEDELSERIDDAEGKINEFSHPIDGEIHEIAQPTDESGDQEDKFPRPLNDKENQANELSVSTDKTQGHMDEFSETVDDNTKDQVNEFSHPAGDDAEDELGSRSHPLGELQGQEDEHIQPVDKTQSLVEEISHSIDETEVQMDEFSTSEENVFDFKDLHMDEATTDKVFIRLSSSTMARLDGKFVDESTKNQENLSIPSLDGAASESRKHELISEEDDIDSEFLRADMPSPTKATEDLKHLNMTNITRPSKTPTNDSNILPLDQQNGNESRFGEIPDENSKKIQSVSDSTEDLDKIDIEEFQGSGDMSDGFEAMKEASLEFKSGRIIDVFPRANTSAECTTPKGERGRCRSLTQCPLSELTNFNLFLQYVCLSRGVLVGICCPDNPVVEISDTTENSTGTPVTELKQPIDGCGLNTNTRIVGGKVSFPHEWTWMVALLRRNRFFCGGVIINDWYILTAAHCVMGIKVGDLKVRLGEYNFNEKNEHQEDIPVAEIKRHALFVTLTFQHDIALLKLKRRIEYSKFIGSICLPNPTSGNFSNVNATVVGWGTVAFGGTASPVLRQVTVPVWDNDECDKTYRLERITNAFMCAGSPENGEDACQGDSGGPLMTLSEEGRWEVIGIVSWGRRCGDPTFPGVYTRVTSYLDWITENAN